MELSAEQVERFWSKTAVEANGCIVWQAARDVAGYGSVNLNSQRYPAHRVAFELSGRAIPEGLHLDHLCRNPPCVNPLHLEAVTCRENVLRGEGTAALNARKTHCPQGHPYDEANTAYEGPDRRWRRCLTCRKAINDAAYARRSKVA